VKSPVLAESPKQSEIRVTSMKLLLPELSLVALVGPSGCGKFTFARKHFKPTEILSSDFFRALISDDETKDAFELLEAAAPEWSNCQ
jgi:ABC-type glutathione transport system ATPase component